MAQEVKGTKGTKKLCIYVNQHLPLQCLFSLLLFHTNIALQKKKSAKRKESMRLRLVLHIVCYLLCRYGRSSQVGPFRQPIATKAVFVAWVAAPWHFPRSPPTWMEQNPPININNRLGPMVVDLGVFVDWCWVTSFPGTHLSSEQMWSIKPLSWSIIPGSKWLPKHQWSIYQGYTGFTQTNAWYLYIYMYTHSVL